MMVCIRGNLRTKIELCNQNTIRPHHVATSYYLGIKNRTLFLQYCSIVSITKEHIKKFKSTLRIPLYYYCTMNETEIDGSVVDHFV